MVWLPLPTVEPSSTQDPGMWSEYLCAVNVTAPKFEGQLWDGSNTAWRFLFWNSPNSIWIWPPPLLICADFLTKSGSKIGGLRLCPVPCTLCLVSCVLCPVSSVLCLVFASSFLCPVSGKRVLIVISHVCVLVWWLRGERGVAAIKCKCLWSRSASNCQRRTVLQQ